MRRVCYRPYVSAVIAAAVVSVAAFAPRAAAEPAFEEARPLKSPAARNGSAATGASKPVKRRPAETVSDDNPLVIVIGGDLGLSGSDQPVSPKGAYRHGARHDWADLTRHLGLLVNGDINFANLETVVTDKNTIAPAQKKFRFRSHPDGVRHLVKLGFNAFSLANNHAIDYGATGMRETLRHIGSLKQQGLALTAGLGMGDDAFAAAVMSVRGTRVALGAVGIGGVSPGSGRVGMAGYHASRDFLATVHNLVGSTADYHILSAHFGSELQVAPTTSDVKKLRDLALVANGVDLVIGHHAHVAAGIQRVGHRYVLFGMGNLLHPGMQNMARFNRCRDFGLMARLMLTRDGSGRLVVRAIQTIALTDMHLRARQLSAAEGARRIEVLNFHASGLDDKSAAADGVRFRIEQDGTGLYCSPEALHAGGLLGKLCAGWAPTTLTSANHRSIAAACGGRVAIANRSGTSGSRSAKSNRKPPSSNLRKVAQSPRYSFQDVLESGN